VTIRLHDSLTKRAEPVVSDGPIGVYSCGPTVYDRIHVGNARPFVVAMVLKRHLDRQGVASKVVVNVTDVNDKIYAAATARGIASTALAAEMTERYFEDTGRLGLGRPDVEPLVTETMPEIIALIERLIAGGHGYEADGDVYFAVKSFESYGGLSGQKPDEMLAEGRVEPGEGKRSPLDFALWKANKPDEDAWWDSPWGRGRPGWHIECSAMAMAHLGEQIDVHGGGLDLIFPHHENERAQSEGATGRRFAGTWLHNGMLRFGDEKMSKSLGNVERLADALDEWGAETLLLLFARAHYRSPMDYNDDTLGQARAAGEGLRESLRRLRTAAGDGSGDALIVDEAHRRAAAFDAALDDDLATPAAIAELFELSRLANRVIDSQALSTRGAATVADVLLSRLDVLGLAGYGSSDAEVPEEVVKLAEERRGARAARDFARADELRDEIAAAGFVVRDAGDGYELVPATR
jgi:cysteinyl-tRNA synthetase